MKLAEAVDTFKLDALAASAASMGAMPAAELPLPGAAPMGFEAPEFDVPVLSTPIEMPASAAPSAAANAAEAKDAKGRGMKDKATKGMDAGAMGAKQAPSAPGAGKAAAAWDGKERRGPNRPKNIVRLGSEPTSARPSPAPASRTGTDEDWEEF